MGAGPTLGTVSLLALSDSYTIGESVDSTLRWPEQLAEGLRGDGIPTGEPVIIARTGWTTDELARGIEEAGLTGAYDLVSLLIGVNNQYRGRELEEYRLQLLDLLSQATSFAREIDAFNRVCRNESEAAGVWYRDVTGILSPDPIDAGTHSFHEPLS